MNLFACFYRSVASDVIIKNILWNIYSTQQLDKVDFMIFNSYSLIFY